MKVALIGSAPSSVRLAPTKDASFNEFTGGRSLLEPGQFPHLNEEWSIWACSPGTYGVVERVDRFFELHRWEAGQTWFSPEYCSWLRDFRGPVYTTEVISEIKNSTRYPRELVVTEFGQYFLTSSLSLMFALAIIEIELARLQPGHDPSQDAVGLWGVDMSATDEYEGQRSGCHFFMMEAKRRGITTVVPPESDLLRPRPIYGVCEWTHAWIKSTARMRELQGRQQACQQNIANQTNELHFLTGAVDNLNYMTKTWLVNEQSMLVLPEASGAQVMYLKPAEQMPAGAPEFTITDVAPGDLPDAVLREAMPGSVTYYNGTPKPNGIRPFDPANPTA